MIIHSNNNKEKMDTENVGYSYNLTSSGWNYKIRNTLSQLSDLFSKFNKYIAPAYHHDRSQRSVPMRIYSMHKGEFVTVFIAFFALLGLGVFIGLAGPPPTITTSMTESLVANSSTMSQGPFHLHSPALGTRSQQLWLFAEIITDNTDEEIFDKQFEVSISIEGVLADHTTTELVGDNDAPNRTLHLQCNKHACEEVQIMHLGVLEYTHYLLNITFYGLKDFHTRYNIREIIFYFKTYNPAFTQWELWFRFTFVLTSFCITFCFFYALRKYHMVDWSVEQKLISCLLPALVFANDPMYPLRLFPGNYCATWMSDTSMIIFLGVVLLSWLAQYHGLRQNDRSCTLCFLMHILVALVMVPAVVLSYWQKFVSLYDPTYNYVMNSTYPVVKVTFFCGITLYYLYLIVLIIKAYYMSYFDIRLRCLSIIVATVTLIMTLLSIQGWGVAGLQDHWASQPKIHYDTSAPFMAMMGLFNFKVYILAYLFSPRAVAIHDVLRKRHTPMPPILQKQANTAILRIDWINKWYQDYVTGKLTENTSTTVTPPVTNATVINTEVTNATVPVMTGDIGTMSVKMF